MKTLEEILKELDRLSNPDKVVFKEQKFGITPAYSLGIYIQDLKKLAKQIGPNKTLALALFETGIYDARILSSKIFPVKELTPTLMNTWIKTFDTWEICDVFCLGLFAKSEFAKEMIKEWGALSKEYEKRSAFATLAGYSMAAKNASNQDFISFFPLIIEASSDNRVYVKKAVSWALRNVGKRNPDLKEHAIEVAQQLLLKEEKAAKWIARDVLKELQKQDCQMSYYPKSLYPKP